MRHHYVTAWLQLDALDSPVLMGVTDGQTPPVWTFGEALEPEQRRKLQQILDACWRDVGGHVGRNTIADMLAALEVASVELVLRLVVPGETEHAMTRQVLELEQGVPTAA